MDHLIEGMGVVNLKYCIFQYNHTEKKGKFIYCSCHISLLWYIVPN